MNMLLTNIKSSNLENICITEHLYQFDLTIVMDLWVKLAGLLQM